MVLPNGIVAGVNKAGTTAIFHALAAQENVAVSDVKETKFFSPLRDGRPLPDLAEYSALFPAETTAQAVVEATPSYFYGGERIARGIDDALPGVRVAVVLREPGSRTYSWWRFSRSRLWIPSDMDFRTYLEKSAQLEGDPETQSGMVGWRGLSGGLYSRYLPAWQQVFGPRLLTLFYDDVRADFEGAMRRICAHFGVERIPGAEESTEHNVTTDVNSAALQRWALRVNNAGEKFWRRAPGVKAALRRGYYSLNARKVQVGGMSPDDRRWLDDYFREEIGRLRELTADIPDRPAWLAGAAGAGADGAADGRPADGRPADEAARSRS
ncbi:sulfotransferase [Geodermatophilus sp. YIM 151500]|uniref:sulfotransferase family protein n=1 Tax=Geodermatophilus sp. YIM 151500 TaxID=2984531 RepID=UPI0021E41ED1|nr:sulfotransferase [Geodermatophilus sp. YIM 151500]MCV2491124.1 sulfotransferase [Geodermatophilus sp. YIM 151500]